MVAAKARLAAAVCTIISPLRARAASCQAYGCVQFTPSHECQCNPECVSHHSCCFDYQDECVEAPQAAPEARQAPEARPAPEAQHAPEAPQPPPLLTTAGPTPDVLQAWSSSTLGIDLYRAMEGAAVDVLPIEDDNMADLGGVMKYIHTEIIVEHGGDPLRKARKYNIDVITRHRYKVKNSEKVIRGEIMGMGEFGPFVTYDWGQATNLDQIPMLQKFGDWVGVQPGCANLHCDVRFPSNRNYNWYSVGNWCPNLQWDKKGTKANPNPECLRSVDTGGFVMGGLCPNGIDPVNFIPGVEPTGQPGCTYTYGKAQTIRLDELAGLTQVDCEGGRKCRDWLDFREHCVESKYKRRFNPVTREIEEVDFCVEFDIHPSCDNCHTDECKALLQSGQDIYLGMPFWSGRCDARANVRRMEETANAMGIAGALDNHALVDPGVLHAAGDCPRSPLTSWTCAPNQPGESGPFCTREYTGACEPCFIPGASLGQRPAPKPWCPLNIFKVGAYADRTAFPLPPCDSKKPTDKCCLYSGTCDGSLDPNSASLDDDGFQLIASLQSTQAMQTFLQRAARDTEAQEALSNPAAVKHAAYTSWESTPVDRTLRQALEELRLFAKEAPPQPTPAPKPLRPVAPPKPTEAPLVSTGCFENGVSFMPMDMDGTLSTIEANPENCQKRCSFTPGCKHFSHMQAPGFTSGLCHMHDALAIPQLGALGFVSGPYKCWSDIEDKSHLIQKPHNKYIDPGLACMEWGVVYSPAMVGLPRMIPIASGNIEAGVLACQQYCAETRGCAHFTLSSTGAERMCSLSGPGATRLTNMMGTMSGPPSCGAGGEPSYLRLYKDVQAEDLTSGRRGHLLTGIVVSIALFSVFGNLVLQRTGRRRRGALQSRGFTVEAAEDLYSVEEDTGHLLSPTSDRS